MLHVVGQLLLFLLGDLSDLGVNLKQKGKLDRVLCLKSCVGCVDELHPFLSSLIFICLLVFFYLF